MTELHFEPSARLQRFLGQQLIADPNLAIIEFVKNAYDAGASEVHIQFWLSGTRGDDAIIISDDGTGMDLEGFDRNWMKPGYSEKAEPPTKLPAVDQTPAEIRKAYRTPIGEKGVGRLASGRLGDRLVVFTRRRPEDKWLCVDFDWTKFGNMRAAMSSIPIPYTFAEELNDEFPSGTRVEISALSMDWRGFVPGRKVRGRSDVRLERLRQDLSLLLQPLDPLSDEFRVYLSFDDPSFRRFAGQVEPYEYTSFTYRYEFSLSEGPDGVIYHWKLERGASIAAELGLPEMSEATIEAKGNRARSGEYAGPETLRCDRFRGTLLYTPSAAAAKRAKELGTPPGVFLYRDGFRVDPYGHDDDDWMGVLERKAARQGHAAIEVAGLSGMVYIGRNANRELQDMSNRQGLVENEAYYDFLAHARAAFRHFEELVRTEYIEPRYVPKREERARQAAEANLEFSQLLLTSAAHSIRQPLSGLKADMVTIGILLNSLPANSPAVEQLKTIQQRALRNVALVDRAVADLIVEVTEFSVDTQEVRVGQAVQEAATQASTIAAAHGVEVRVGSLPDLVIQFNRAALLRAIGVVVTNAIEAPRPESRTPEVAITGGLQSADGGRHRAYIDVTDNGTGVEEHLRSVIFESRDSTKGRPSQGLVSAAKNLRAFNGDIKLVSTNQKGTIFRILLPTAETMRELTK